MKFLVTNDDGIDATGLTVLESVLGEFGDVVVVAPHEHLSGCSHQVNTHRPLQLCELTDGRFSVDGTPADCTRLGLLHVAQDVDWVVSGINDGGNLGVDVCMSGTVAAVREAALLGKPGIAFSQYRQPARELSWTQAAGMLRQTVHLLFARRLSPRAFWNVNFPHLPQTGGAGAAEVVVCPLEPSPMPVRYDLQDGRFHYKGDYHERPRKMGTDVDVCFSGNIAVTEVPAMP